MQMQVIRIGQNSEDRHIVDVVLVGFPKWESGRVSLRLKDDDALLEDLSYGTVLSVRMEVLQK